VKLFLRLFANCESQEAAQAIAARTLLALFLFSPKAASTPKRYWKFPHLFEFTYTLSPASDASFQQIISASSGGWHHSEGDRELSSVWNRSQDHVFLVPEVCWAELQLHESAA
jgi:hypothetical protein